MGTACYWEANSLGSAGYAVTVLYTGPTERHSPAYWEAHFAGSGAPFRYVDLGLWAIRNGADRRAGFFSPPAPEAQTSELVLAYLRQHRFDLVLFQEFQGHGLRTLQAREAADPSFSTTRMVVTLHGSRHWTCEGMQRLPMPPDLLVDFLEKDSTRLADGVIAPSASMADWVVSRWGVTRPTVIPYCYDGSAARPRRTVAHDGPFRHLVFFGRLETRKGVQLLVQALARSTFLQHTVERVTFLGKHARIEGVPSATFLQKELANLSGLQTEVISDKGSHEAVAWLKAQDGILVVAPSLGDNLPYALIELFTHQIPFISTRVGGIPDIVGTANRHLLAEPTVEGLQLTLERSCTARQLVIDYRDGYNVHAATNRHIDFVAKLIAARTAPSTSLAQRVQPVVVVVDAPSQNDVDATKQRCGNADGAFATAAWMTIAQWRSGIRNAPAIFLDSSVVPQRGLINALCRSLENESIDASTTFYDSASDRGETSRLNAPLGAAIDLGWSRNVFGGPCFIARPSAFGTINEATADGRFDFWPVYAALICSGRTLAVLPEPLYTANEDATITTLPRFERVVREYHRRRPSALDWRWILKAAYAAHTDASTAVGSGTSSGRALYDRFIAISDDELRGFAELDARAVATDSYFRDFAQLRQKLTPVVARWRRTKPRVFVYGAGLHTRVLLSAFPSLGAFVAGFIDRRAAATFLGKPCIRPEDFTAAMADAVVYSSPEFEREMYARVAAVPVEHVLLYHDVDVPVPTEDTSTRLQNRFNHRSRATDRLADLDLRRPAWMTGSISGGDMRFLFEIIQALQPRRVLELGVAAGCSSAALLYALDELPPRECARELYSFDLLDRCYFNTQYATGEAAAIMYPGARTSWHLRTGVNARSVRRLHAANRFDLAFIDANHCHPWPLLDLLHLTQVLLPHSWVVLHDIELPNIRPDNQDRGALLLFEQWPFNKVHGVAASENIGAVQLPHDPALLLPIASTLLGLPWQDQVAVDAFDLPFPFDSLPEQLRLRVESRTVLNTPV